MSFAGREALRGVDFEAPAGAVTAIAGPNGAGKSTLLEVIAGTLRASAGTRDVPEAVAFVPQRTDVSDRLPVTVRDVVTIGAWGSVGPWRRLGAQGRSGSAGRSDKASGSGWAAGMQIPLPGRRVHHS